MFIHSNGEAVDTVPVDSAPPPIPIRSRAPLLKPPAPSPLRPSFKPSQPPPEQSSSTTVVRGLKVLSEISLSCIVLVCAVFSKLSLVGLADNLGEVQRVVNNGTGSDTAAIRRGVALYWQLLLILLIPNAITLFRCLLFGCVGKSGHSFPFPRQSAFIVVSQ